jgi:predicted ester cyclase
MNQQQISTLYRAYIDCINANTMGTELPLYCQSQVTHNDRLLSLEQYQRLIQESKDAIPDLHFHIDSLLVDEASQMLAVIIRLTGKPTQEINGLKPTGKSVHFSEHVFYQLEAGKIYRVRSLVDWDTVRMQLAA